MIIAISVFSFLTVLIMFAGQMLYAHINGKIFDKPKYSKLVLSIIFVLTLALMAVGAVFDGENLLAVRIVVGVLSALNLAATIYLIVKCLALSLFQPIALTEESKITLIVVNIIAPIIGLVTCIVGAGGYVALAMLLAQTIVIIYAVMVVLLQKVKDFGSEVESHIVLFDKNESGYATFRIPSIINIDHNILNEKFGYNLQKDILIASVEGRKKTAKDLGVIDVLIKISTDNGKNWSELIKLITVENKVVKCGNPTPIFDKQTGLLNYIHLIGEEENGWDYRTYNNQYKIKEDLTFELVSSKLMNVEWSENVKKGAGDGVTDNTIMAGPGKGIQLASGRLVLPASRKRQSYAMLSDDNGMTWHNGDNAGSGNECEIAELANGELVMVTRAMNLCHKYHNHLHIRLAYSNDNGESWYKQAEETQLKTPICMTGIFVDSKGNLLLSGPDNYLNRSTLTLHLSEDDGKSFKSTLVYSGASGYSDIEEIENNQIVILAELGRYDYNEQIYFITMKK